MCRKMLINTKYTKVVNSTLADAYLVLLHSSISDVP